MRNSLILSALLAWAGPLTAQDGVPLSAIGWLSDSVTLPVAMPAPVAPAFVPEPPVTLNALPETITVTSLDAPAAPRVAATGLFPPASAALPGGLWDTAPPEALGKALATLRPTHLAATQGLLRDMLAATTDPGQSPGSRSALFLGRVDALLALGDLGTARSMLDLAGREDPRNFRRWFDIALLTGQENAGCSAMRRLPQITPTYPARVFCLARGGDWAAAELTLETASTLGVIDSAGADRLRLFLDDRADTQRLPPPATPTPLDFAIYGAVGTPLRTSALPLAFAHADLRPITGWKPRIEAAERLARLGAIPPARLWEVYAERSPAASGGVWDRVEAVQSLDRAIASGDPGAVSGALPPAWDAMRNVGLAPTLAQRHAAALNRLPLTGPASGIAVIASLLASEEPPAAQVSAFLQALGDGTNPTDLAASPLEAAIADGLHATQISDSQRALIDAGRLGEAALRAIALLDEGTEGNLDGIRHGLALMQAAGFGIAARQAAIEVAILGPDA